MQANSGEFIPIDEEWFLSNMEEVGRRHRSTILVQVATAELLTRHSDRGIEQAMIPNSRRSVIDLDGVGLEE